MSMRIFVASFQQETNAFNPIVSKKDMFWCGSTEGQAGADNMVGGMLDTLLQADMALTYGPSYGASSGGPVDDAVWQEFLEACLAALRVQSPFDGVCLCLHGATASPTADDVCGAIVAAIRAQVGETVPIAVAHDLHGNVTPLMAQSADFICGYHEYPHIDRYETGMRAAALLTRALHGEPLFTAYAAVPVIAPAHAYTTREGALRALTEEATELVARGEIADFSIFQAQPWIPCGALCRKKLFFIVFGLPCCVVATGACVPLFARGELVCLMFFALPFAFCLAGAFVTAC